MIRVILVLLYFVVAMDVPTAQLYVSDCVKRRLPISLDQFWTLPGTLSEENSHHVLSLIKDNEVCTEVKKFKNAGHIVTPDSILSLALLVPEPQTFICACEVFGIKDVPGFNVSSTSKLPESVGRRKKNFSLIMKYIRSHNQDLTGFEKSIFEAMNNARQYSNNQYLLRQMSESGYLFTKEAVDIVMKKGLYPKEGQYFDKLERQLVTLYENVDDVDCFWLDKFITMGLSADDRLMDCAVKSGFDSNLRCVLKKNPKARCTYIGVSDYHHTNDKSPLVQEMFRMLIKDSSNLRRNVFRAEIAYVIFKKPRLMTVLYEENPGFFITFDGCLIAFLNQVEKGNYETPQMFLSYSGLEIGYWIFNSDSMKTSSSMLSIVKFVLLRKKLNNVKNENGKFALHYALNYVMSTDGADSSLIQELIDAGADVNIVDSDKRSYFTPLYSIVRPSLNPIRREVIRILLDAGADTKCLSETQSEIVYFIEILSLAQWYKWGRHLALGLSDPGSHMGQGANNTFLLEIFYESLRPHMMDIIQNN